MLKAYMWSATLIGSENLDNMASGKTGIQAVDDWNHLKCVF